MISVTTTTVTTVTAMGLGASIAIFGTILLIGLLITKELAGAGSGEKQKFLAKAANIAIIPLVVSFVVVVGLKVVEILG